MFKESLSKPRHRQFWLMMVDDLWLTFPHLNWCFAIMFGLNPPYWFDNPCICWWIFPLKRCFIGKYRDVSKKMLRYLDLNFEAATQVICSREISQIYNCLVCVFLIWRFPEQGVIPPTHPC